MHSDRSFPSDSVWYRRYPKSRFQQLTHGPGDWQGSPTWSPDGRPIAFDSRRDDGHTDLWVIDVDGGRPRQVTRDPGDENMPTWSRDGRWLHFSSNQGAGRDVWRVPASGGRPQRLTHGGSGLLARESPDGKSLIYQTEFVRESPLLSVSLAGGPVRQLAKCVRPGIFNTDRAHVYYGGCGDNGRTALHQLDPATNRDRILSSVEPGFSCGRLAVSPDGKNILVQRGWNSGDLMLIENFR
jgi:eukaryotic-like serine/threonine-protein kinase